MYEVEQYQPIIEQKKERIFQIMKGDATPIQRGSSGCEITTFLLNIEGTMYRGKGHEVCPELQLEFKQAFSILDSLSPSMIQHSRGQDEGLPQGAYSYHLITGRPEAYVEAFCLSHHLRRYGPHVVERGAIICTFGEPARWDRRKYLAEDNFGWSTDLLSVLEDVFRPQDIDIRSLREPGKDATLTLNTPQGMTPDQFAGTIDTYLKDYTEQRKTDEKGIPLKWVYTQSGVDIFPESISKAKGAEYLIDLIGRTWDVCAAFGDSMDDVPVFKKAGICCVSKLAHSEQAIDSVRDQDVSNHIVSDLPHGWGTLDGLYSTIEHNLAIRQHTAKRRSGQIVLENKQ